MKDIWRNLYVVCFRVLVLVLSFMTMSGFAQQIPDSSDLIKDPVVDRVLPLDYVDIENGEIYEVVVDSEKSFEELSTFKNKKINDIMYVLETEKRFGKIIFKVFVTDPPKKKKDKVDFIPVNFNYNPTKKNVGQNYITYDKDYTQSNDLKINYWWILVFSFFVFTLFYLLLKLLPKYRDKLKNKRKRREKAQDLLDYLGTAKIRADFENIFRRRKDILSLINLNEDEFELFLNEIDKIQYRREWSELELNKIKDIYKKLAVQGINRGI